MSKFTQQRPVCVFDTECLPGYWSIGFKSVEDGRTKVFELYEGHPLDKKGIAKIFRLWRVVGFNSIKYDLPMILYAMSGADNEELKRASDELIQFGVPHWTFMERHGLTMPDFIDHIDLMSVSPGAPQMPSLKIYAGRLHSRKMQEMPVEHDEWIDDHKRQIVRAYHGNDLDVTIDLYNDLRAQLDLRALMSAEYGVDLRSKSDAQIAEAVIKSEIEKTTGRKLYAPDIEVGYFNYVPPAFIQFKSEMMQEVLQRIRQVKFVVDRTGVVKMPDYLKDLKIELGSSVYRMGIGGLHSSETRASHYSDDEFVLLDRDVTSYYPNIILNCGLYPKHIGPQFLKVYKTIYDRRLAAKKSIGTIGKKIDDVKKRIAALKEELRKVEIASLERELAQLEAEQVAAKNTAESLKLTLNGSFGKLGSPYSALYSPNLMIQVTMTGQLSLLMLIERLEVISAMSVVSANTDGFVTKVPRARRDEFNEVCVEWERETGFALEETEYRSLHSRDVNSYIAIDKNGKAKLKGAYTASGPGLPGASGQKKNPDMDICTDAVVAFLKDGTPIEETIEWCADPCKFLTVRRVTGGAVDQDGNPVGKALRWYYSKDVSGGFTYAKNGNAVPQTIGARLMMTLLPYVPADIDYDYYIREAYAILQDLGVKADDPRLRGRTGNIVARLPDQKTYHLVDARTGIALCGKARESIRDSWEEIDAEPSGRGMCKKCKEVDSL